MKRIEMKHIDLAIRIIQAAALVAIAIGLTNLTVGVKQKDRQWDIGIEGRVGVEQNDLSWKIERY